jgi:hypothetical protein
MERMDTYNITVWYDDTFAWSKVEYNQNFASVRNMTEFCQHIAEVGCWDDDDKGMVLIPANLIRRINAVVVTDE